MRGNTNTNRPKKENDRGERSQGNRSNVKNAQDKNNSLLSSIFKIAIGDVNKNNTVSKK